MFVWLTEFISCHQKPSATVPLISPLQPVFAAVSYPPPPPYSALPSDGLTYFSTNYPHLPNISPVVHSVASDQKASTSKPHLLDSPVDSNRVKKDDRSRQHKKKKKKRKRHSSYSSSSDSSSNSSLNIGEYLRVEKKQRITTPSKSSEKERKIEGHRWSSSSTESDEEQCRRIDQKNDNLPIISSLHDFTAYTSNSHISSSSMNANCPPCSVTHTVGQMPLTSIDVPRSISATGLTLPLPTYLPPSNFPLTHVNPSLGAPFNPLFPPPSFHLNPEIHAKRDLPKVALRFVEDSPSSQTSSSAAQQTLADRVASIFGCQSFSSNNSEVDSTLIKRHSPQLLNCNDLDDMDVDIGSSSTPPALASPLFKKTGFRQSKTMHNERASKEPRKSSSVQKKRFVRNVAAVREATEKAIGEEIVDIVSKDFYKRIEVVSFEILEEVLMGLRHELEEQKRNEAQEALRAQAQLITSEKPSDVAQLGLNATSEKLTSFPFTINMPKLPSFKRKVRPPSPESESSESPVAQFTDVESDGSDAAQKSSTSSGRSSSRSETVIRKVKKYGRRSSYSGSDSVSESSSVDLESSHAKSPQPFVCAEKESSSFASTAVCKVSSLASSSRSLSSCEEDNIDENTISDKQCAADVEARCHAPEIKVTEKPLWERIINDFSFEWSEIMPRALYHVNLSEHCYFKLLKEDEEKNSHELIPDLNNKVAIRKKVKLNKHERELLGLLPAVDKHVPRQPLVVYPPWSDEDKFRHIYKWDVSGFLNRDISFGSKDQEYLKQAWLTLQPSGDSTFSSPWSRPIRFNFSSWSNKPRLLDKPTKKGRVDQYLADSELDGILPIEGGCARTRGFFKMSMKEKRRLIRRPEDEQRDTTLISERDEAAVRHNLVVTKESRSMHRRLLTTMGDTNTDFFKVNQLKYRKKMIKFARSRIHGWGLYAMEAIAPDDMIVEYVGQKVRNTVADVREKAYERRGIGSSYLFRIDDTAVIDATRMGNFARFINHSCQPNCYAKVVTVDGEKRIVIYSKTLINKGDEITYDYKFPIEEDKVDCLCGAPNCRGTLN
ncbi:SET domain protein [Dictyocaulus viviparus]|uniref:[histone H3]-lysine(4) N-trimethyltransferase n=1 Tax=Dictyocaulus viviparus TaxID=29172 RepID=A0A0D8Y0B1_DICVI|nr:SET domain protein [Dictyocaulus viviparus]